MKSKELLFSAAYFALVVCFISPIVSIAQNENGKQEELIIGEWFPLSNSNGLSTGFTFDTNGKAIFKYGVYVTIKYKLDGDTLINEFPGSPVSKQKIKIDKSEMILSKNGKEIKLARVSEESDSGIIGEWTGEYRPGTKQTMHFTTSHDQFLIIKMKSTEGTYKIKKDSIMFNGKESYHWFINSDTLTINSNNNNNNNNDLPEKYVMIK